MDFDDHLEPEDRDDILFEIEEREVYLKSLEGILTFPYVYANLNPDPKIRDVSDLIMRLHFLAKRDYFLVKNSRTQDSLQDRNNFSEEMEDDESNIFYDNIETKKDVQARMIPMNFFHYAYAQLIYQSLDEKLRNLPLNQPLRKSFVDNFLKNFDWRNPEISLEGISEEKMRMIKPAHEYQAFIMEEEQEISKELEYLSSLMIVEDVLQEFIRSYVLQKNDSENIEVICAEIRSNEGIILNEDIEVIGDDMEYMALRFMECTLVKMNQKSIPEYDVFDKAELLAIQDELRLMYAIQTNRIKGNESNLKGSCQTTIFQRAYNSFSERERTIFDEEVYNYLINYAKQERLSYLLEEYVEYPLPEEWCKEVPLYNT